jgi:hypothetical protein
MRDKNEERMSEGSYPLTDLAAGEGAPPGFLAATVIMRVSPWSIFTFGVLGETGLRAAVPRMNGCT